MCTTISGQTDTIPSNAHTRTLIEVFILVKGYISHCVYYSQPIGLLFVHDCHFKWSQKVRQTVIP